MSEYQIAVVVGSLRRDSFNRKLAHAMVKLAPSTFSFNEVKSAISHCTTKMTTRTRLRRSNG